MYVISHRITLYRLLVAFFLHVAPSSSEVCLLRDKWLHTASLSVSLYQLFLQPLTSFAHARTHARHRHTHKRTNSPSLSLSYYLARFSSWRRLRIDRVKTTGIYLHVAAAMPVPHPIIHLNPRRSPMRTSGVYFSTSILLNQVAIGVNQNIR